MMVEAYALHVWSHTAKCVPKVDWTDPPSKVLSFLVNFLVLWILLAIRLRCNVKSTEPALQKGRSVGVRIFIGEPNNLLSPLVHLLTNCASFWTSL